MAQHAFARTCKNCGTLCTFAGNLADAEFSTKCPCCGNTQTAENPSGAGGLPAMIQAEKAAREQVVTDLQAQVADLQDTVATLQAAQAPIVVPTSLPPDNGAIPATIAPGIGATISNGSMFTIPATIAPSESDLQGGD